MHLQHLERTQKGRMCFDVVVGWGRRAALVTSHGLEPAFNNAGLSLWTHSLAARMNSTSVTITDSLWKSTVDGLV